MQLQIKGIVKEIKVWTVDRNGVAIPAERQTEDVTFFDLETMGDLQLTFPAGTGLQVGSQVSAECVVMPVYKSYKLRLYVKAWSGQKPTKKGGE